MPILKALPVAAIAALVLGSSLPLRAEPAPLARLLKMLSDDLRIHDSATAVLQSWCDAYGPGGGVRIVAQRAPGMDKPLPEAGRAALGPAVTQGVRYRRVRLACAGRVLSEADNWYLPSRLTPPMNAALDSTDTPFGVVVRRLDFHRRNLTSRTLYDAARQDQPPPQVLENSAVLSTTEGAPFSYVVETYTGEALSMAASSAAH
jgi:chorismate-pyruvate lyase